MPVAITAEEPEHSRGGIGEEIHEHGSPKDPGKVASVLHHVSLKLQDMVQDIELQVQANQPTFAITFAVDLPTNPPILSDISPVALHSTSPT